MLFEGWTATIIIIVALRIIVPLGIFRWPLALGIVSILLDGADVILANVLAPLLGDAGNMGPHYHQLDKVLDMYFLAFMAATSLRWNSHLARNTSLGLFAWRAIGFVLFEITGMRAVLLLFPNLFENFFVYYLVVRRFFPRIVPRTIKQLLITLVILAIPKLAQEWVLHYAQLQPWEWMKREFLRPWGVHI
jgi:hypothetical protein